MYSYQTENADVAAAFQTARSHLHDGGVFIFDVWYGPGVLTSPPAVRIKWMADEQIEVTRIAEPVLNAERNVVDVSYHLFIRNKCTGHFTETRETHSMRYFFKPEIDILAFNSGFSLLNGEEWLTEQPLGRTIWGACFTLRAT